jgi:hypothetical protein
VLGWIEEEQRRADDRFVLSLLRNGRLIQFLVLAICGTRGGPGVRTCFQLRAVLTMPANRASSSEVPAAPPAVTSTHSQSQRSSSQRATARRCRWSSGPGV